MNIRYNTYNKSIEMENSISSQDNDSMNIDNNNSIYNVSYVNKLRQKNIENMNSTEIIYKTYNEYLESLKNISKENIIEREQYLYNKLINSSELTDKQNKHQFITDNLTNICGILNNLKIKNPKLENIKYNDFVDIFYNNISVNEKEVESDSDMEIDEYEYWDDYNDY